MFHANDIKMSCKEMHDPVDVSSTVSRLANIFQMTFHVHEAKLAWTRVYSKTWFKQPPHGASKSGRQSQVVFRTRSHTLVAYRIVYIHVHVHDRAAMTTHIHRCGA